MKPKNKKIMTVGLAVSAIGIWIPQVFVGVVEPRSSGPMDVPNGDAIFEAAIEEDQSGVAMDGEFMALPASGAGTAEWENTINEGTSFKAAMSSVAGRLERQSERPERVNLDDLMSAFRTQDPESAAKPISRMKTPQLSGDNETRTDTPLEHDILEQFCASANLSAVIQGDAQMLGMLNGRLVREGDLLGHGIEVVGFQRRSILLQRGEQHSSVGLPSFRVAANSAPLVPASVGAEEMEALDGEPDLEETVSVPVQGGQHE